MKQYFFVLQIKKDAIKAISPDINALFRSEKQDHLFVRYVDALTHAENLAKENPGHTVCVFTSTMVIETEIPKVFRRKFNEKGELLPDD